MATDTRVFAKRLGRAPFLILGIGCLATGIWGGLTRLPLSLPIPEDNANWITFHGVLMVCGFLGTVIALERAVGLQRGWAYVPAAITGLASIAIAAGYLGTLPLAGITLGSALFVGVATFVVRLQPALFTGVMALAALAWLVGNVTWWLTGSIPRAVPWWMLFLGLTIVGERLDLTRFQRPSPWARPLFLASFGMVLVGALVSLFHSAVGERLLGAGWLAGAVWLTRFDLARRAVQQPGLPRFMAVCLLAGYGWLAVSAVMWLGFAPLEPGLRNDAVLHAFFVGFVFSMIFGHAPVIFPSVMHLPALFRPRFYAHVVLLHVSLVLRVGGDLANAATWRQWGAILNGIAVLWFLLNTVTAMAQALRTTPPTKKRPNADTSKLQTV